MNENMDRLPKWAQSKITKLEKDLATAQKQLRQIGGESETNVFWGYNMKGMACGHIPEREPVTFKLGEHDQIEIVLCKIGTLPALRINGKASYRMCVAPDSSNQVTIFIIDPAVTR